MQWFLKLSPEMQLALVLQACGTIFASGVWWATVRALRKAVVEVKQEVKEMRKEHDDKLDNHGERLAALEAPARLRHGGGR